MVRILTLAAACLLASAASAATKCTTAVAASSHSASVLSAHKSAAASIPILPSTAKQSTPKTSASKSSSKTTAKTSITTSKTKVKTPATATGRPPSTASSRRPVSLSGSKPSSSPPTLISNTSFVRLTSSPSSYTRPSTCPPHPPSSFTTESYGTSTSTIYTGGTTSTTVTSTAYRYTSTTITITRTQFVSTAPTTSTTRTFYTTTYLSFPASQTVTAETPPGFTPVNCLPTKQYAGVVTIYGTTLTATSDVSTQTFTTPTTADFTFTHITYSATTTSTISFDVLDATFLSTVTVKRTPATRTIYAACATNNIVAENPNGGFFDYQFPAPGTFSSPTFTQGVQAFDMEDCCSQCQANSSCTGSGYYLSRARFTDGLDTSPGCVHFFKSAASTCSPTFQGQRVSGNISTPLLYISNSGCGQFGIS